MHCVFSYDLKAQGERRIALEEEINKIIKPYRWAKRLTTFYIIEIKAKEEWDTILTQLKNFSKNIPEQFHFIMSPIMSGGLYDGILASGKWDFVNEITKS